MPSGLLAGEVVLSGAGRNVLGAGQGREGEKRRGERRERRVRRLKRGDKTGKERRLGRKEESNRG